MWDIPDMSQLTGFRTYVNWIMLCDGHCMIKAINSLRPGDAYLYLWVNMVIIGLGNGLVPNRHQIIWTNADL